MLHNMSLKMVFCFLLMICHQFCKAKPDSLGMDNDKQWLVALPLRFTQLQDKPTMLSGIKLGRRMSTKFCLALSVYHSFYLKSFKAKANLIGFDEQPRLFINGVGAEAAFCIWKHQQFSVLAELFLGWGFMKYDVKESGFKSKQFNFLAIEPALDAEYGFNPSTSIALGVGYRPLTSKYNNVSYTSHVSNGSIPIYKTFPNGMNLMLTLKGYF